MSTFNYFQYRFVWMRFILSIAMITYRKVKKKTAIKCTGYNSHCVKHASTISQWNLNQTSHHNFVESQTIYLFNWIVQKTNPITYRKMQLVEWVWDEIGWFLVFWILSADEWMPYVWENCFCIFFEKKIILIFNH